jgi:hypothetical protein
MRYDNPKSTTFERFVDLSSGAAGTKSSQLESLYTTVSILRQSRRLYGCWPLKGA